MSKEKILDDLAQLAGGTASAISGISQNIRADVKARVDEIIDRMDLVPRADFEKLQTMLEQSRIEQDELRKRLDDIEKQLKTKKK